MSVLYMELCVVLIASILTSINSGRLQINSTMPLSNPFVQNSDLTFRCKDGYAASKTEEETWVCLQCTSTQFVLTRDNTESCTPCGSTCEIGEYAQYCGGGDSHGTCKTCDLCDPIDSIERTQIQACSNISDTVCANCKACLPYQYESESCSEDNYDQRVCLECASRCPPGTYSENCGKSGQGTCTECEGCEEGFYRQGCGGNSSGICIEESICIGRGDYGLGEWLSSAPDSTHTMTCLSCTPCENFQTPHYLQGCSHQSNGSCIECVCQDEQYITGCSGTTPLTCENCITCGLGLYRQGCSGFTPSSCHSCNLDGLTLCSSDEFLRT